MLNTRCKVYMILDSTFLCVPKFHSLTYSSDCYGAELSGYQSNYIRTNLHQQSLYGYKHLIALRIRNPLTNLGEEFNGWLCEGGTHMPISGCLWAYSFYQYYRGPSRILSQNAASWAGLIIFHWRNMSTSPTSGFCSSKWRTYDRRILGEMILYLTQPPPGIITFSAMSRNVCLCLRHPRSFRVFCVACSPMPLPGPITDGV